jgi:hypothetical protein
MGIEIPKKIFGREVEGAMERALRKAEKDNSSTANNAVGEPVNVQSNIDRAKYIKIPNANSLIAREEAYHNNNFENTHRALVDDGLYMPTVDLWMRHFVNVVKAARSKTKLLDGNGNEISRDDTIDLYKYLTSDHRDGCWTWLDAKFEPGSGNLGLNLKAGHRVVNGNLVARIDEPLVLNVEEDCYVGFGINHQGFPRTKVKNQNYRQGKNIFFFYPRENTVAGFYADSDRTDLDCDRNPSFRNASLGVFACAVGTSTQNSGGN